MIFHSGKPSKRAPKKMTASSRTRKKLKGFHDPNYIVGAGVGIHNKEVL